MNVFSKFSEVFSPKGLTFPGGLVKLQNPTQFKVSISGSHIMIDFEPCAVVTVKKEITLFGKTIMTPSFSREVSRIVLTENKVVLELENWPDFTLDY